MVGLESLNTITKLVSLDGDLADNPQTLEPGVLLFERFCVLGEVTRLSDYWYVPVSDVKRELGDAPHHRLILHVIETELGQRTRLRRAIEATHHFSPRVICYSPRKERFILVTEDTSGDPLGQPNMSEPVAISVAQTLATRLAALNRHAVTGIRFQANNIFVDGTTVTVRGFEHLLHRPSTTTQDIKAVTQLIRPLAEKLTAALGTIPRDAEELLHRLSQLDGSQPVSWATQLPVTPPLVGRTSLVSELLDRVASVRRARAACVLLQGPEGIGKSRVLSRLQTDLNRSENVVVIHGHFGSNGNRHGGALIDALRRVPQNNPFLDLKQRDQLSKRMQHRCGPLVGVVTDVIPELAPLMGNSPKPPPISFREQLSRFSATIAQAIAAIGTRACPAVLLLDDVDRADRGSIAVLNALLRDADHHTLVVTTARDEPGLFDTTVEAIELDPLNHSDIEHLLNSVFDRIQSSESLAKTILKVSEGNPLRVWLTLQAWLDEGHLRRNADGQWSLPAAPRTATVFDIQRFRIDKLDSDGQRIAILAAISDGAIPTSWISEVTGWDAFRVNRACAALVRSGLVVFQPVRSIALTHKSTREAICDASSAEEIRDAHREISEWMNSNGASATQRAYHAEQACDSDQPSAELAELHLAGANDMLRVFHAERAAWHFSRAETRAGENAFLRAAALKGKADTLLVSGDQKGTIEGYLAALSVTEDNVTRIMTAGDAAETLIHRFADTEGARKLVRRALKLSSIWLPKSWVGRVAALLQTTYRLLFKRNGPKHLPAEIRSALCRLYMPAHVAFLVDSPSMGALTVMRGAYLARGLRSADAAICTALWGCFWATVGRKKHAHRMFATATNQALSCGSAWAEGFITHLTAQFGLFPKGNFNDSAIAMDHAIACFQRTGDMSIAALSFAFKALYGLYREPASRLLNWLGEARIAARRHGNRSAALMVEAMSIEVETRKPTALKAEKVHHLVAELEQSSWCFVPEEVVARSSLAAALINIGQHDEASRQAERAVSLIGTGPAPETILHAHAVAAHALLERPSLSKNARRRLKRHLKRLRRSASRSRRLKIFCLFLEAKAALRLGKNQQAKALLDRIVSTDKHHGETFWTWSAHRVLTQVEAATNVLVAATHQRTAKRLAQDLQLNHRMLISAPAGTLRPVRDESTFSRWHTEHVVEELSTLARELFDRGRCVIENSTNKLEIGGSSRVIRSALTQLMLCVRDIALPGHGHCSIRVCERSLSPEEASRIPTGLPGRFLCIETTVHGVIVPDGLRNLPGIRACRHALIRLDGFIASELTNAELCLRAYIPSFDPIADATSQKQLESAPVSESPRHVLVIHSSIHVRQSVAAAARGLGLSCTGAASLADADHQKGYDFCLVEQSQLQAVKDAAERPDCPLVILVNRGTQRPTTGKGAYVLTVPFAVSALEDILRPTNTGDGD